ncbi:Protein Y48G1C.6 [Aphelenchoides avenae]|nr:Protein Y48G1C.6 [Aphelenchus avenae]
MSGSEASVNDDAPGPNSSGRKMKEYSVKFKLQVAERAIANRNNNGVHVGKPNIHPAAKLFGVPRKNVRRWLAQEAKLKERKTKKGGANAKNLPGQGRPIKNKDFEKQLNGLSRHAEGNGVPNGADSLVQARHESNAQNLEEIMHGLELEAPEDPEDDAADNASNVSVVSGGEENADESVDEAEVEESDTDSEF